MKTKKTQENDEVLVQMYRKGDFNAFGPIVERYNIKIRNYIFQIVKDKELAEDITQDVFLKAMLSVKKDNLYTEQGTLFPWLIRIAHNLTVNFLRKRKYTELFVSPVFMLKEVAEEEDGEEYFSQMYNYSQGFEETIICKEAEYNIQELLEELPYEKKEVLVLRMFHGFRYVDIAQYVGVPLGTIKSRIFNALHDLRKKINKKEVFNKHEQSPYN